MPTTTMSLPASIGALPVCVKGRTHARLTDKNLLLMSQTGDSIAAHCLIGRYRHVIDAVAWRMAGSRQDAADTASEIYLRVFEVLNSCRSAATLPGWIKKIAINVFFGLYRKDRRRPSLSLDFLEEIAGDSILPVIEEYPAETPQGKLEREERRMRVRKAVASLSPEHQQVVELFYMQERSYDEIAAVTYLSLGTIKSRLFRAREAMQRKINDLVA